MFTRLLLFGAPRLVRGPDDAETLALQPKRAAVLTYLVMARPGPLHPRDSLLAMFWPEHDADRGRNALSKVIHHLRRAIPPEAILTQGDQIGVAREQLWCDVTEFERALEAGRDEDALALYRGDLLQGFHIRGAPDFDHWSDVERSRLRRMAVASAWDLASDAERAGDGPRATKFARQAVEWAPRDESGFRRFLTLLQSRGNRAEALEAFETFARELRREYGVAPSGPTLELVDAIRDGSLACDLAEPLLLGSEPGPPAFRLTSPEPALVEDVGKPGLPSKASIRPSGRPRLNPRLRRRIVVAALSLGVVGLVAMSLQRRGPIAIGGDRGRAGSVLVTDFDDGTDEGLGAVVAEALRIDLAQSRVLDLVDRADVVEALQLMGLEPGAPISAEVGREVAVRDGLGALVEGSVVPVGSGYILTAAVREGGDGRTIASFRESVTAPDQMIRAIDDLSLAIREALGESVGTIHESVPLERVTTPSLEALTLYTRATQVFDQFDDRSEAAELLQKAVGLDPGFAMAWRMLAVARQDDADQSPRMEAVRQAFHQRDRLSQLERHLVEASYYSTVEVDRARAVEALLRALDVDPENGRAWNNLGLSYLYLDEVERAEEVFRRLVRTSGVSSTAYRNLVETRLYLGRFEEAAQALAEFEQKYPNHRLLPGLRVRLRFLAGAVHEARAELRSTVDDPLQPAAKRADAWAFLGRIAYWEGKYDEGRSALLEAERVDAQADEGAVWARIVETANTAALVGDTEWARAHIETRVQAGLPENVVLKRSVTVRLIELLALTSTTEPGDVVTDELARAPSLAGAYARIQAGDTVGLRALIEGLPLHLFQRALLAERLGDADRTIELYEKILRPGYTSWGSDPHRLRAIMRLGPLYEQTGDTLRAIEAYDAFARRWTRGDERGRAIAERFATRARALESGVTSGRH